MMVNIRIDGKEHRVTEGLSVIAAARTKGYEIPSMCYRDGKQHFTSCMICMVKDRTNGKLFPSCSIKVQEGMDIVTVDDEIRESRKTALDLLLSEHTGDCEAPCQVTCPAHMDIPQMNRLLAKGKFDEALRVVKKDIALPAVFGQICPAPCEGACRRKSIDQSVSICLLKRYAGEQDLFSSDPWEPKKDKDSGKKVAIIGAGPAGLAAAYYLLLSGHQCDVYFRSDKPGGSLLQEVEKGNLSGKVLESEIDRIIRLGAWFYPRSFVDPETFRDLQKKFDAVLVATGSGETGIENWGILMTSHGVEAARGTYTTSVNKVFSCGSAVRNSKMAIRPLGQGKEAAYSIDQFLKAEPVIGEKFLFNSRFGKLLDEEISEYLKESVPGERIEPSEPSEGLAPEEVMKEAARCLHCDCRDLTDCKLRMLSDEYGADQKRYWSENRQPVQKHVQHTFVIYEPNKCIKCGICVHIAEEHQEKFGMSFIGRGFDVIIDVPFGEALENGLENIANLVVEECPTGALAAR